MDVRANDADCRRAHVALDLGDRPRGDHAPAPGPKLGPLHRGRTSAERLDVPRDVEPLQDPHPVVPEVNAPTDLNRGEGGSLFENLDARAGPA